MMPDGVRENANRGRSGCIDWSRSHPDWQVVLRQGSPAYPFIAY
jgi:hypothetical protein